MSKKPQRNEAIASAGPFALYLRSSIKPYEPKSKLLKEGLSRGLYRGGL